MVTKVQVLNALKKVYDPEFPISVVDLGLIYDVKIAKDKVSIKMTLTNPGCPMSAIITQMVREKVEGLKGVKEAAIDLVFEPQWTPERISNEARKKFGFA
jgi:metal-sulfur cluster biosynthetic enzyme